MIFGPGKKIFVKIAYSMDIEYSVEIHHFKPKIALSYCIAISISAWDDFDYVLEIPHILFFALN